MKKSEILRALAKWNTQSEQMHLEKVMQGCHKPSICGRKKKGSIFKAQ